MNLAVRLFQNFSSYPGQIGASRANPQDHETVWLEDRIEDLQKELETSSWERRDKLLLEIDVLRHMIDDFESWPGPAGRRTAARRRQDACTQRPLQRDTGTVHARAGSTGRLPGRRGHRDRE